MRRFVHLKSLLPIVVDLLAYMIAVDNDIWSPTWTKKLYDFRLDDDVDATIAHDDEIIESEEEGRDCLWFATLEMAYIEESRALEIT